MKILSVILCAIAGTACAKRLMSPTEFTREFARMMNAENTTTKVQVQTDLQLRIQIGSEKPSTAFLDNAYRDYVVSPDAWPTIVHQYSAGWLESVTENGALDPAFVVPVIKDRGWIEEIARSMRDRGVTEQSEFVYDDFNEQLIILYALDTPKDVRFLAPKDLKGLDVTRSGLRSLAVKNLRRILPRPQVQSGPLVSMLTADGNYESSLLLLDELWKGAQLSIDGEPVVAIPSRDVLLFTGSNNAKGIERLRELASKLHGEASHNLTDDLFVFRDGRFSKFDGR